MKTKIINENGLKSLIIRNWPDRNNPCIRIEQDQDVVVVDIDDAQEFIDGFIEILRIARE